MSNVPIISTFEFLKHNYQHIHSAGPKVYFYHPIIGYVKKGYAKILYRGMTYYANEGDLIYISYGTKYYSIWIGTPDIEWYSIEFNFKSQYDFYEYQFQIIKDYPSDLFDKVCQTYDDSPLMSMSYFYMLLDDLHNKLKSSTNSLVHSTMIPAIEYIETNYNQDITISTLAKLCNCSESGFFKLFRKSTGVTPITYKHNIMIQHALELITHTTLSIEEISSRVGFSSSNYFRKVFFKFTEKTPKSLRKK